jgi:predicted Zn-dependent protease
MMKRAIFLLIILLNFSSMAAAQKTVILNAMKDELARSMQQLKLEGEAGPYYISYFMIDVYQLRITADSGAITINAENRNRVFKIDLRVGSYAQDNSNFFNMSNPTSIISSLTSLPIDNDYDAIRRQLWQVTDRAYKNALETLVKKKAALQNSIQPEALPDFVKGEANSSIANEISFAVPRTQLAQRVDQIAKLFLKQQNIQKSRVALTIGIGNSYYINSEGAMGIQPLSAVRLAIAAATQAKDGMSLDNYRIYTTARPEDLPEKTKLDRDVESLISGLLAARTAPLADEYSGPVLFMEEAAGELFSQGFANLLAGTKLPTLDSPQTNAMLSRMIENPFSNKIGMKVAANFLSLKAVPSMNNYDQMPLLGAYGLDDEGVPVQDVSLIENGILKNLLSSRSPVKGAEQSNGHARGGGVVPSIIQMTSSNKKSYPQLKQDLINAAKEEGLPFGYIVRGLTQASEALSIDSGNVESSSQIQPGLPEPNQFRLTKPYSIFRVYPDGREERVRGVEFGSISINAFKNVLAASENETVYAFPINSANRLPGTLGTIMRLASGMVSQGAFATVITPSLLINGIDLKKSTGKYPKLPIVSYPIK